MLREIEVLRVIAERCRSGGQLGTELAQWLGLRLEAFLAHKVRHIDQALGIRAGRGGVAWWMEESLRKRDAALRALAQSADLPASTRGKARVICDLAKRYAASTWRFDRERSEMPVNYVGTYKAHLWVAFRSGAPMPIGERQLRGIIGAVAPRRPKVSAVSTFEAR